MNGIHFYADLPGTCLRDDETPAFGKRATRAQLRTAAGAGEFCNVVALLTGREHDCRNGQQEALAATFGHPNSDVCLGGVDRGYLRQCRRIDEALARKLHPRMFARLDAN